MPDDLTIIDTGLLVNANDGVISDDVASVRRFEAMLQHTGSCVSDVTIPWALRILSCVSGAPVGQPIQPMLIAINDAPVAKVFKKFAFSELPRVE